MRMIKFRAWNKDLGVMMHNFTMENNKYGIVAINSLEGLFKNFELMQFTGCTDKNGDAIYEGDIVSSDYDDYKYVVKWYQPCSEWLLVRTPEGGSYPLCSFGGPRNANEVINLQCKEILGNIYEMATK